MRQHRGQAFRPGKIERKQMRDGIGAWLIQVRARRGIITPGLFHCQWMKPLKKILADQAARHFISSNYVAGS
jgi:hypothetical protein